MASEPSPSSTRWLSRAMAASSTRSMRWIRKAAWAVGSASRPLARASRHSRRARLQHARQGVARAVAGLGGDLLQRAAGVDLVLEAVGLAVEGGEAEQLVDDHRPRPQRGEPQPQHDAAHHPVGAHEQMDEVEALRRDRRGGIHRGPYVWRRREALRAMAWSGGETKARRGAVARGEIRRPWRVPCRRNVHGSLTIPPDPNQRDAGRIGT